MELENGRLVSEILHLKKSATGIRDSLSDTLMGKDELNNQIQNLKTSDEQTKSKVNLIVKVDLIVNQSPSINFIVNRFTLFNSCSKINNLVVK